MCRDSPNSFDQIKKVLISNHVTGPIQTESIKGEPTILTWSDDHLTWDNLNICPPKFEFQSWNYYEFLLRPCHITLFLIGPWRVCSFWGRIELQNESKWPKNELNLIWGRANFQSKHWRFSHHLCTYKQYFSRSSRYQIPHWPQGREV